MYFLTGRTPWIRSHTTKTKKPPREGKAFCLAEKVGFEHPYEYFLAMLCIAQGAHEATR